jgi:hypothetical protein
MILIALTSQCRFHIFIAFLRGTGNEPRTSQFLDYRTALQILNKSTSHRIFLTRFPLLEAHTNNLNVIFDTAANTVFILLRPPPTIPTSDNENNWSHPTNLRQL